MSIYSHLPEFIKEFLKKKYRHPFIYEFEFSGSIYNSEHEFLNSLYPSNFKEEEYITFHNEYLTLAEELQRRIKDIPTDRVWDASFMNESAFLVYYIIRKKCPNFIVETGVSRGLSTFFILKALEKNNKGSLLSFDIIPDAGYLILPNEKKRWVFICLKGDQFAEQVEQQTLKFGSVDIFLHDSDHSYKNQFKEYNAIMKKLSSNGIILSDDVDFSYAFNDFVKLNNLKAMFLITTKAFGLCKIQDR